MKLRDIAALVGGEVRGDGDTPITGVAGITTAREGDITFIAGPKMVPAARESSAAAVLVKEFADSLAKPQVRTGNPQLAFAKLLARFYVKPHSPRGISSNASVADDAVIGQDVSIYDFAFIAPGVRIGARSIVYPGVFIGEGCTIGEDCLIYPNVTIREGTSIGNRTIIHAGAVIGSDGFGYVYDAGSHYKIPQVGAVIIEDDVEIGANTAIDRATTGATVVKKGTKIDNLVQIGHNVQVGRNVIVVAQVGVAGSSEIGDGVVLGGQAGVADHTRIEAGAMIGAQSGVLGQVKQGVYSGSPIMPHREWLKASAVFARLPELKKKIEELEKRLQTLSTPEEQ